MSPVWSYVSGLGQGILAAKKWLLAYILLGGFCFRFPYCWCSTTSGPGRFWRKRCTRTMQQTLEQAALNMTYKLDHIRDISNSVFMNRSLYDNLAFLRQHNRPAGSDEGAAQPRRDGADEYGHSPHAAVSRFVQAICGGQDNLFPLSMLESRPWYKAVMAAGGGMVWTESTGKPTRAARSGR